MNKKQVQRSLVISTLLAAGVAWAGSQNGQEFNEFPLYALCVILGFAINWLAFIPAFRMQTEKFFDLTGSLTYIGLTLFALFMSENIDQRSSLLGAMVILWAVRLGSFLFQRIHKTGKDDRFDKIKPDFMRFWNTWTLQALWAVLTVAPAWIAITAIERKELGIMGMVGVALWVIGFLIEVIADRQKTQFRNDPANKERFIQSGLWSKSRHPNYFGEIVLWLGITLIAIPVLQGCQLIALISPIFVTLLLTRVSGIPMLEAKAERKWGDEEAYQNYKKNTPILIPKL
ncbi:MAG: DUF1295 domain-containing protein [Bacteroidota bacterium]